MTQEEKLENLAKFVNYAKSKNIFVNVIAFHYKNVHEECSYYLYLRDQRVLLILPKNRTKEIILRLVPVDLILQKGGHIRLSKGIL